MSKILIVDDEADIRESVKMLIQTIGKNEIKTVNDGKKAIKILQKEKFDLVLLDILMPKMSGIETLQKIRQNPKLKNQKVIFLTVVIPSEKGSNTIKKLKPLEFIKKPIDNTSFKKKIKKILG